VGQCQVQVTGRVAGVALESAFQQRQGQIGTIALQEQHSLEMQRLAVIRMVVQYLIVERSRLTQTAGALLRQGRPQYVFGVTGQGGFLDFFDKGLSKVLKDANSVQFIDISMLGHPTMVVFLSGIPATVSVRAAMKLLSILWLLSISNSLYAAAESVTVPDRGLEARAQAFWDARVAGDLVTAYEYEKSSQDGTQTLQAYVGSKGNLNYRSAQVLDVVVGGEEDEARVSVAIEVLVPGYPGVYKSTIRDRWVKIDDQWYHSPLKPRIGS
jgi:hypothetical protein